jgi:hypothetical protein
MKRRSALTIDGHERSRAKRVNPHPIDSPTVREQSCYRGRVRALAIVMSVAAGGCGRFGFDLVSEVQTRRLTFDYTGANQSFTIPDTVSALAIKMWGAGGGGAAAGTTTCNSIGSVGGAGAYAAGDLIVTPGQIVTLVVGGGGSSGVPTCNKGDLAPRSFGGGGAGFGGDAGGGGRSAVLLGGTEVFTAGGGGGGGSSNSQVLSGGAGGGPDGQSATAPGGIGGSTTAGGSGGVGGLCTGGAGGTASGGDGGSLTLRYGSGGGGGYWGGGGGGASSSIDGGGGGGSSYLSVGLVMSGTTIAGNGATPPGQADPDYQASAALGGAARSMGGNGLIIIDY